MNRIKEPVISIIIPVYNVEKYLSKCIDSIINQTYKNIEIILIDDGSTDSSGAICDKYALIDSRIHVLHIENGGVSNARNVGLSHATGDYIGFVDSDDYIAPNMYERLLEEVLADDVDVVQCNYADVYIDRKIDVIKCSENRILSTERELVEALINHEFNPGVWAKLYKKEVIHNVYFNTDLKVAEDLLFNYHCCRILKRFKLIPDSLYYYFQRDTSVVHTFTPKFYYDMICVNDIVLSESILENDSVDKVKSSTVKLYIELILKILIHNAYREELTIARGKLIETLPKSLFLKNMKFKRKIAALLIWLMPNTFYRVYSYIKHR